MTRRSPPTPDTFKLAQIAIASLLDSDFTKIYDVSGKQALAAHSEMSRLHFNQKTAPLFRRFVPLRQRMSALLADAYRRFFKLALTNPRRTGGDPDRWAWIQLQPAVDMAVEWIRQWYSLACDGPDQRVSLTESASKTWRAPSWLFRLSLVHFGVRLYPQHLPNMDSDERLGESHTRLLLKGARRLLLSELGEAIERARNEEIADAGAIRADVSSTTTKRRTINREGWKQRLKLYNAIQTILSAKPNLQGIAFCAELDKRHAPPLLDWMKSGEWREGLTWKEAWNQPRLRSKIRRVRQEAQKRPSVDTRIPPL